MFRNLVIFTVMMAAFFSLAIFSSYTEGKKTENTLPAPGEGLPQVIKAVDLNKNFSFAGESLPVDNFDAIERLDRELLRNAYWHSNTALNIKKAYRYFPVIEQTLAEHGLPDDLKYLAVAESDLSNATSPAGAKGIWQFMPATAQSYGLEVNREVDERFHLEKATEAACKHLKKLHDRFGNWTLAAAAYNMGASGLAKDLKLQRAENYYDLNLNQETSQYIFRVVAIKEIMEAPSIFGFQIQEKEKYQPLDAIQVKVDGPVTNWGDFAKEQGITYRMLKIYNPWLLSHSLSNRSGKSYLIKIPKQG